MLLEHGLGYGIAGENKITSTPDQLHHRSPEPQYQPAENRMSSTAWIWPIRRPDEGLKHQRRIGSRLGLQKVELKA
jgi:hypothetical protein